jgi:hypothetical protein
MADRIQCTFHRECKMFLFYEGSHGDEFFVLSLYIIKSCDLNVIFNLLVSFVFCFLLYGIILHFILCMEKIFYLYYFMKSRYNLLGKILIFISIN